MTFLEDTQKRMPLVSIIMPFFDAKETISDSVDSVLAQTEQDFELILVDDCSRDDGYQIVTDKYAGEGRIKIFRLAVNSGAGVARNFGIEKASGRFVAFLDADDLWYPNKLTVQLSIMLECEIPFICSAYDVIDNNGVSSGFRSPPGELSYHDLLHENKIGCLTVVYDTEYFGKRYMPTLRKRQDYALWLSLLRDCENCVCVQQVLAAYRLRPGSVSSNKLEMLKGNYDVFRHEEAMPWFRALYWVGRNVLGKLRQQFVQ